MLQKKIKNFFFDIASSLRGSIERKSLNASFAERMQNFFRRKQPSSKCYPFILEDPYDIFGNSHPYASFYLVGSEWRDKESRKPVALLWGFNDWKLGFVSAYLPEYRTAFAPRKKRNFLAVIRAIKCRDIGAFIIWGYNEPFFLCFAAKIRGIPVYRMEDGFLRSAELGSAHTTPYSLVLDGRGLYYNPQTPSDLEEILNHHEFNDKELSDAKYCMDLMQELRLSKYNPAPVGTHGSLGLKVRRRVAVIGQVKNDRSVRMGNVDSWSEEELVRLAKHENPGAEIIYRPHPDVYRGFQRNIFRRKGVENFCTLSPPEGPLPDFLDEIDHVYVITSLAGLEALLRGIKVTVVGAAFYAGWGLTDDRVSMALRREKKRSLVELFAAVYLKYPRYLGNTHAATRNGFEIAAFRILADSRISKSNALLANARLDPTEHLSQPLPDLLPCIILGASIYDNAKIDTQLLKKIHFHKLFAKADADYYKALLFCALFGRLADDDTRAAFLRKARVFFPPEIYKTLLIEVSRNYQGDYLIVESAHFALLQDMPEVSAEGLQGRIDEIRRPFQDRIGINFDATLNEFGPQVPSAKPDANNNESAILRALFEYYVDQKLYIKATETAKNLLLKGITTPFSIWPQLWKLADITFQHSSAYHLADLANRADQNSYNRNAAWEMLQQCFVVPELGEDRRIMSLCAQVVSLNPERSSAIISMLKSRSGSAASAAIVRQHLELDNYPSTKKALAWLAAGKERKALQVLCEMPLERQYEDKAILLYAEIVFSMGQQKDAQIVTRKVLNSTPSNAAYTQAVRQLVVTGAFAEALRLFNEAHIAGCDVSNNHLYTIYQGLGRIREAFQCYKSMPFRRDVRNYFPKQYMTDTSSEASNLVLLAAYGPGDEVRFASIYVEATQKLNAKRIVITCDERLLTLLSRSLPDLEFLPVKRTRALNATHPPALYDQLPGSDLCSILDNKSLATVIASDAVMLVTDMLADLRPEQGNFPGEAFLKPDKNLVKTIRSKLPNTRPLVGISWRSFLSSLTRDVHYLSVEDLEPLFRIPNVTFINLQYDDCDEELAWADAQFPGKLINFPQLDLFNDFESAVALMACLDLIISPATSIAEMAGASGRPTWLFGKSAELDWRKRIGSEEDLWFKTVKIILGSRYNDTKSIVETLEKRLRRFADAFLQRSEASVPQNQEPSGACMEISP
jgi:capsular polysaccharide export protein